MTSLVTLIDRLVRSAASKPIPTGRSGTHPGGISRCASSSARRVPKRAVSALPAALVALPVKTFPFTPDDLPPGCDVHTDVLCHCQLGSAYQMIKACEVELVSLGRLRR